MPIYEYQCKHCGEKTESLQKVSDPALTMCPHCHQDTLVKMVSSTSFQLKGTGWYVTDFRDKKKPMATEKAAPETHKKTADTKTEKPSKKEKTSE